MTAQERTDWLKRRQTGIGGSDVAAILGLSHFKTPLEIYESKIEEVPTESHGPLLEWGHRLEPVIRQAYSDATGLSVVTPEKTFRSEEHPFMIADVDGICSDGRILEIKTARTSLGWGEPGTDEIPEQYLTQVQHYMTVLKARLCDVAVLIGGSDFRIYTVMDDPELATLLIREEAAFWEKVQKRTPPAPRTYEEAQQLFPTSRSNNIEASADIFQKAETLVSLKKNLDDLKKEIDSLQADVTGYMAENDTLTFNGTPIATWKTSKGRKSFSSTAFAKDHPDLYSQYLVEGTPSRRFLLKIKKD